MKNTFFDRIRITAKAGRGGDGCVSFRREKYVPRGGPDGGNGGSGGDVVLEASGQTASLRDFYFRPMLDAPRGMHGRGKKKSGLSGADLVVKVPRGTMIRTVPEGKLLHDLVEEGERFVLVRGGKGGRGNAVFATSTHQAPREAEKGEEGEEGVFLLELRLIADVGLVGWPNAGKSTLISRISAAKPRIAAYPFTTLSPVLGVMEAAGGAQLTVADIPGLIEGAHANIGLGHDFLRHIERTRLLIFILDMAASEGRDPLEDFSSLRRELKLYDPALAERPYLVAANKMDLPQASANLERFRVSAPAARAEIIPVSAREGKGITKLKEAVFALAGRLLPAGGGAARTGDEK